MLPVKMLLVVIALLALSLGTSALAQGAAMDEGVRLFEQRQYDEARSYFTALAAREPRNAAAPFYLGRIAMAQNDPGKAAPFFEQAVKLEPGSSTYHDWLGRAYGRQAQRANPLRQAGLARATRREFERAVDLDPNNLDAREDVIEYYLEAPGFLGGSVDKARSEAAAIAQRNPRRGHLAYARLAEHDKRLDEAEQHYEAALASATSAADSLAMVYRLGVFYQQTKQWPKAADLFENAVRRSPDEMGLWFQIGRTGALSGERLDRAEQALLRYLEHQPKPGEPPLANAHFRLGQVYERRGDAVRARSEYEAALSLDPKLKDARESLARLR
jgi:tetratricopeptide (TPR) repeat protein